MFVFVGIGVALVLFQVLATRK